MTALLALLAALVGVTVGSQHTGLTDDQQAIVSWALGRFEAAELEVPPVRFERHTDPGRCSGRIGIAIDRGDHTEIGICTPDAGPGVELMILHELAHAWDHRFLDDARRLAFLAERGLRAWREPTDWHSAGAEQAAEILVWALADRPIEVVRIGDASRAELRRAYEILTGDARA